MSTLTITGKAIGSRKALFADWSIPFPPEWEGEGGITLRDLIEKIVRSEVKAFQKRERDRRFLKALTSAQISEGAEKGKIEMGRPEVAEQAVDEESAVAAACQAFEDGLDLVAIDGQSHRQIDSQIHLQPDSKVAFVRLTLLAGG